MGLLDGGLDNMAELGAIGGLLSGRNPNWPMILQQLAAQKAEKERQAQMLKMQQETHALNQRQGNMQLGQMERSQGIQDQLRQAAGQAFAPPQEAQGPMPGGQGAPMLPGGGGMPDFAQRAMAIDPMVGMQYLPKPRELKFHNVNGNLVQEPTEPGGQARPVFTAPKEPKDWQDPAYQEFMMKKAAAGRPQVTTNVMNPREVFKDSLSLKKDFDGLPEVKGFKEVQGAWDQISTALQSPSPANDLAAATKFMKLLDPGSVVRESELMMAMQASGALDRMANMGNRILKGHKLTPEQRRDFYSAGEQLYKAAGERFGQSVQQYEGIADQYGLDKQFIPKQKDRAAQDLKVNQTATYKAKEAIKRGADPEAVKQRLMEQGYDPKGL
jgi:hypothetical protein